MQVKVLMSINFFSCYLYSRSELVFLKNTTPLLESLPGAHIQTRLDKVSGEFWGGKRAPKSGLDGTEPLQLQVCMKGFIDSHEMWGWTFWSSVNNTEL